MEQKQDNQVAQSHDSHISMADERVLGNVPRPQMALEALEMLKVEFGNATIHEMEKVDALTRKKWKWGSDQS